MPRQISNHQPGDRPSDRPSEQPEGQPNVAEAEAEAASDHGPALMQPDLWVSWRKFTPARIALGRVGASQPTDALLQFSMAHANARDAVYEPLDLAGLLEQVDGPAGCIAVKSRAADRAQYLRRPDWPAP